VSTDTHLWFDAGVNLFSAQFGQDRDQVVSQAHAAGVCELLLISSDLGETQLNLQFCAEHDGTFSTAGVHPHQADHVSTNWLQQLELLMRRPEVVAVGECGLDYNRMFSAKEQQIRVFSAQLSLAKQYTKAVYLHERDAFTDQIGLLKTHQVDHGIAHCFTGDVSQLRAYLDLGLYIGITGWLCDERRGTDLQLALKFVPLDRLVLETDAPYLLPRNLTDKPKNRRNEPAFLPAIGEKVSALLDLDVAQVAAVSRANSLKLFGIPADA
jgi:TatD DNase family protein